VRRHGGEGTTDMRGGEATGRRLEGEVVAVVTTRPGKYRTIA
jgi:hypothetical protein